MCNLTVFSIDIESGALLWYNVFINDLECNMKKLLIFDLDGTLADTLPSITRAINLAANEFGYPERSIEDVRRAIGNGARLLCKRLMPKDEAKNDATVDAFLDCYESKYDLTYAEADTCYDGMSETLEELYKRGYMIAVLSNKQDKYVKPIAAHLVPAPMLAYAAGQRAEYPKKPDPTVPLSIVESLGADLSACAFIGDSDVDVKTGKNMGVISVGCDWGYRPRAELIDSGADFVISKPEELLNIFK